jgi:hypothetical protein
MRLDLREIDSSWTDEERPPTTPPKTPMTAGRIFAGNRERIAM